MNIKKAKSQKAQRRYTKRRFLAGVGVNAGFLTLVSMPSARVARKARPPTTHWDIIVVGAGTAGLPLAIFAGRRGARVLVIEAAGQVGGTLFLSSAQMSAAGTKLQKSKGIEDTPDLFYDDVMRISRGTATPDILRLAVDNAAETVDWLFDNGFEARPEHPVLGGGHDPYSRKRYFWAADGGLGVLKVLEKQLKPELDRGTVTILTQTEVTELVQDTRGKAVIGVIAKEPDGSLSQYLGRSVALTSGGYCSNSEMFERIEGVKNYADTTYPYSQGIGITLAVSAGGYVRGRECHQPLFNAVLADDDIPSPKLGLLTTDPARRPAWEIFVNERGERFVREDTPSYDEKEKALAGQPKERCWIVFDDVIMKAAPPLVREWNKAENAEAFGHYPLFYRANTLPDLAALAGISAAGLTATVSDYNLGQASGNDTLGRKHMPLPIAHPPFYAVRMQGYFLLDAAGIAVDTQLRVVRQDGAPIPNLYAAGELLGFSTFQGRSYCGGMSVTPALTFGRLLGQKILPLKS